MTHRLLITGSRRWTNQRLISLALLAAVTCDGPGIVVVHGACPTGADNIADTLARQADIPVEPHPADWANCAADCRPGHRKVRRDGTSYCPTAGHRRNQAMVDLGAYHALVFMAGQSSGTADCLRRIKRAGIDYTRWDA